MSEAIRITNADLSPTAPSGAEPVAAVSRSAVSTALDGLKGRIKARGTRLTGPSKPLPKPPETDDLAIELHDGPDQPGIPSKKVRDALLDLKQTSYGGEMGSTCVPVAISAAAKRIKGASVDLISGEAGMAQFLADRGSKVGVMYSLERAAGAVKTPGIEVEGTDGKPAMFDARNSYHVTDALRAGGAVIIADQESGHAFTALGIVEPGMQVDGQVFDQTSYLIHNGAPQVAIDGLTERNPDGPTLSWVSADQFHQAALQHHGGMMGVAMTPNDSPFPGGENPLGLAVNPGQQSARTEFGA